MSPHNERLCIDVDECQVNNAGCEQLCVNEKGSFRCECNTGYMTHPHDPTSCIDEDECQMNNGGCEHKCTNTEVQLVCI